MAEQVHDPKMLRAIAHPVRNRILGELSATGPMRAADVARELGIPANQASFHLRQLAKYGLVEEDPEAARDRRDRVWRTVSDDGLNIDVGDLEKQPGGRAAAQIFMQNAASWAHLAVDRAYGDDRTPGTHRATLDQAVRLTKDEGRELTDDLAALLKKWTERTKGHSEARRTYLVHLMVLPYPELAAADPDPDLDSGSGVEGGLMAARLQPADPAAVTAALARIAATEDGGPHRADLRLLVKHFMAVLEARAPGHSVEVRVPPYAAVQVIPGVRHTRGTPPAVVETDALTWIALATGSMSWVEAGLTGRVTASGQRADLTPYLPLT